MAFFSVIFFPSTNSDYFCLWGGDFSIKMVSQVSGEISKIIEELS